MESHSNDPSSDATSNPISKGLYWIETMVLVVLVIWALGCIVFMSTRHVKSPSLEIISLTVTNFNLSYHLNQISADWSLKPLDSHGYFKFSDMRLLISYGDNIMWDTNLMSFDASPKNPPMHFGREFLGLSNNVNDSTISDIRRGVNAGTVKFDVGFVASVKLAYKLGSSLDFWLGTRMLDRYYWWIMNCENVELAFGTLEVSKAHMLNASHTRVE